MPKTRSAKEATVATLTELLKGSEGVAFAKIEKHSVKDDTELRATGRAAGIKLSVIKRTLLAIAAKEAGVTLDALQLSGTTVMASSADDAVAPAKLLHQFGVTHPGVELLAAIVEKNAVGKVDAVRFALLPSLLELRGQFASVVAAPLRGFASVINGPIRGFATVLARRAESLN